MTRKNGNDLRDDAASPVPEWLDHGLREYGTFLEFQNSRSAPTNTSTEFRERCRQAARDGLARTPAERRFNGFSAAEIQKQLQTLIEDFTHNPHGGRPAKRMPELLEYLVRQRLEGKTSIKEVAIAMDVYHKGTDFAPEADQSVRVAINRLRNHLKTYYEKHAAAVQIHLPAGSYCPVFGRQPETAPSPVTETPVAASAAGLAAEPAHREMTGDAPPVLRHRWSWLHLSAAFALVLLVAVAVAAFTYIWRSPARPVAVAPIKVVAFRILEPSGSAVNATVIRALLNGTKKYAEAAVVTDQKGFDAAQHDLAIRAARAARATVAVWGQVAGNAGEGAASIYFAVLDTRAALPPVEEVHQYPTDAPAGRINRDLRVLSALSVGLSRFEGHRYEAAIAAFSDVLAYAAGESELPVDLAIARFYRGLAQAAFVETADLKGNPEGALHRLRDAVDDFTAVLEVHKTHAGSYWNRGLAYEGIGDLLRDGKKYAEARQAYRDGISDFTRALDPGLPEPRFLIEQPNDADVLWNRGLTYANLSEAALQDNPAGAEEGRATISAAIKDLETVLYAEPAYAKFVKQRAAEIHLNCGFAYEARAKLRPPPEARADATKAAQEFKQALLAENRPTDHIREQAREALSRLGYQ